MSKTSEAATWQVGLDVTRPEGFDDEAWTLALRQYVVAFLALCDVRGDLEVVEETVTRDEAAMKRYPALYRDSAPYVVTLTLRSAAGIVRDGARRIAVENVSVEPVVAPEPAPSNGLSVALFGLAILWFGQATLAGVDGRMWDAIVCVIGGVMTGLAALLSRRHRIEDV